MYHEEQSEDKKCQEKMDVEASEDMEGKIVILLHFSENLKLWLNG